MNLTKDSDNTNPCYEWGSQKLKNALLELRGDIKPVNPKDSPVKELEKYLKSRGFPGPYNIITAKNLILWEAADRYLKGDG